MYSIEIQKCTSILLIDKTYVIQNVVSNTYVIQDVL